MNFIQLLPNEIILKILQFLHEQGDLQSIVRFLSINKTLLTSRIFFMNPIPSVSVKYTNFSILRFVRPREIVFKFALPDIQKEAKIHKHTLILIDYGRIKSIMRKEQVERFEQVSIEVSDFSNLENLIQCLEGKTIKNLFINRFPTEHGFGSNEAIIDLSKIKVKETVQVLCDDMEKFLMIAPESRFKCLYLMNCKSIWTTNLEFTVVGLKCKLLSLTGFSVLCRTISELARGNRFRVLCFSHCGFLPCSLSEDLIIGSSVRYITFHDVSFYEYYILTLRGVENQPLHLHEVTFSDIKYQNRKFSFPNAMIEKVTITKCNDISLFSHACAPSTIANLSLSTEETQMNPRFGVGNFYVRRFVLRMKSGTFDMFISDVNSETWSFAIIRESVIINIFQGYDTFPVMKVKHFTIEMDSGTTMSLNCNANITFDVIELKINVKGQPDGRRVSVNFQGVKCGKMIIRGTPRDLMVPISLWLNGSEIKSIKEEGFFMKV
jgi:hypothetical protein